MSTATEYPHLTIDDGGAHIGRTRYRVQDLAAEHYHYGWSAEEILRQHLDLRPEEVYAALTYFYDHLDEILAEIQSAASATEQGRQSQRLTREELLKRRAVIGR